MAAEFLLLVNGTDNLLLATGDDLLLASSTSGDVTPVNETGARSVNTTIAASGASTITLTNCGKHLFVSNRSAGVVYFTVGAPGVGLPATAVAAADDTYPCPAASTVRVPATGGMTNVLSIISDTASTPVSVASFDIQPDHRGRYD